MTPEQQNITIAETCGWKPDKRGFGWLSPCGTYTTEPDYCNDLNAMHEAENHLKADEKEIYWNYLFDHCDGTVFSRVEDDYKMLHATAAQRAGAFLRTLKLWEHTDAT